MGIPNTCAACGLIIEDPTTKEPTSDLCSECTLDGKLRPVFEIIVYRKALLTEKGTTTLDEGQALEEVRQEVAQLPYWKDKKLPEPTTKGLIQARQLMHLESKMNRLTIDEKKVFEQRDF